MFFWSLGKVLDFVLVLVLSFSFCFSFVGFWGFFKLQSLRCNFSQGSASNTIFAKIINAKSNNISSFPTSCLFIYIQAGHFMNNKTESICITLCLQAEPVRTDHPELLESSFYSLHVYFFLKYISKRTTIQQVTNEDLDTHTCRQIVFCTL